jgi:hypothetical protein
MRTTIFTLVAALLASSAWFAIAQDENRNRRGGRGGGDFLSRLPVYKTLDKDSNGELSAEEIKNASAALLTLDKDNDGKLSKDELAPAFGAALLTLDKDNDGKLSKDELAPAFGGRRGGGNDGGERSERRRPTRPEAE